jgi:isopenicillin N synthase-like dioxygenase
MCENGHLDKPQHFMCSMMLHGYAYLDVSQLKFHESVLQPVTDFMSHEFVFSDDDSIREKYAISEQSTVQIGYHRSGVDEDNSFKDHFYYNPKLSGTLGYEGLEVLESLFGQFHEIGMNCLRTIANKLSEDENVDQLVDFPITADENCLLKINRYSTVQANPVTLMLPHIDLGLLTLIPLSCTSGLEIYDRLKETWISAETGHDVKNKLIVFPGAQLQRLTTDILPCPVHQVRVSQGTRISNVFFLRGSLNAVLDHSPFVSDANWLPSQTVNECNEEYLQKAEQMLNEVFKY